MPDEQPYGADALWKRLGLTDEEIATVVQVDEATMQKLGTMSRPQRRAHRAYSLYVAAVLVGESDAMMAALTEEQRVKVRGITTPPVEEMRSALWGRPEPSGPDRLLIGQAA